MQIIDSSVFAGERDRAWGGEGILVISAKLFINESSLSLLQLLECLIFSNKLHVLSHEE